MAEGDTVSLVLDVLEDILQDVFSRNQWDIAGIGKAKEEEKEEDDNDGLRGRRMVVPGPHFNICQVVRTLCPSRVMCSYSLLCGVEVLHLECVKQQASGYCGHYALHFALCCLEACHSSVLDAVLGYIGETHAIAGFWRRYWMSIRALLVKVSHCEESGELWWPWTKSQVYSGDMERSYLSHLLSSDAHLQLLGREKVLTLHYAYGCIQNSIQEVCNLQERIQAFQTSPAPHHLVFILGVTNHWISTTAYKTKQETSADRAEDGVGIVYMDSNNVPLLQATDVELKQYIAEAEAKRIKRKGKGYSDWKRGVIFQSFVDQRELLKILAHCLAGHKDLRTELLDSLWLLVIRSYEDRVQDKLCGNDSTDKNFHIALLLNWLENEHRPQSLKSHQLKALQELGAETLSVGAKQRITKWIRLLQTLLAEFSNGIEILEVFNEFLTESIALL